MILNNNKEDIKTLFIIIPLFLFGQVRRIFQSASFPIFPLNLIVFKMCILFLLEHN
ncbi:MAG: hypothetical protein HW401_211 [Parcubacteria group bacterium]|nr:hypothetical protein [Parcubacteria group bacterium]